MPNVWWILDVICAYSRVLSLNPLISTSLLVVVSGLVKPTHATAASPDQPIGSPTTVV